MSLTRTQRKNLAKLADYLESLPEDYAHFDMGLFLDGADDSDEALAYARTNGGVQNCGTAACAIGHGPAAGVFFRPTEIIDGALDWPTYSDRFARDEGRRFAWAFGGPWDQVDNHHWGAAARIRYLLKHGKPPVGFTSASPVRMDAYREFDKRHAPVPA